MATLNPLWGDIEDVGAPSITVTKTEAKKNGAAPATSTTEDRRGRRKVIANRLPHTKTKRYLASGKHINRWLIARAC